jgi:hypothetical protein
LHFDYHNAEEWANDKKWRVQKKDEETTYGNSQATWARALYSASAELQDTTDYILDFHEINE